jgi:hypothetical protein
LRLGVCVAARGWVEEEEEEEEEELFVFNDTIEGQWLDGCVCVWLGG